MAPRREGDGLDGLGGLQFIFDEDYSVRYDLAFPVKGAGWPKVTVAWDDLILTTNPAASRRETTAELAEACRKAAQARITGLADTDQAFHEAGRDDQIHLFVHDRVHLSKAGHEIVAETLLKAIESGAR